MARQKTIDIGKVNSFPIFDRKTQMNTGSVTFSGSFDRLKLVVTWILSGAGSVSQEFILGTKPATLWDNIEDTLELVKTFGPLMWDPDRARFIARDAPGRTMTWVGK